MSYIQRSILAYYVNGIHWHLPAELIRYILFLAWEFPMVSSACAEFTMFTVDNIVHIITNLQFVLRLHVKAHPPGLASNRGVIVYSKVIAQVMDKNNIYIAVAADEHHPEDTLYSGRLVCPGGGIGHPDTQTNATQITWQKVVSFAKIISLSSFCDAVTIIVQKPTKQQLWVYTKENTTIRKVGTGKSIQSIGQATICDGVAYNFDEKNCRRLTGCIAPKFLRLMNFGPVFICDKGVYRNTHTGNINNIGTASHEIAYPPGCVVLNRSNGPYGFIYATAKGFYRIPLYDSTPAMPSSSHTQIITWEELGVL